MKTLYISDASCDDGAIEDAIRIKHSVGFIHFHNMWANSKDRQFVSLVVDHIIDKGVDLDQIISKNLATFLIILEHENIVQQFVDMLRIHIGLWPIDSSVTKDIRATHLRLRLSDGMSLLETSLNHEPLSRLAVAVIDGLNEKLISMGK